MEPLFPDTKHLLIFCFYCALFVNQTILVTASKNEDGSYSYNTTTVVLLTEVLKLFMATVLYVRENSFQDMWSQIVGNIRLLVLYLIPSFLYCLYNNLAFRNLQHFDPATYFLLLNFRTVVTGVIFQFLFSKKLTVRQWLALLLLTVGCIVKQVKMDNLNQLNIQLDFHLALMLMQIFCSCFAGVYNEYLLKDSKSVAVPIMVQNTFMYLDSILMNIGFLVVNGTLLEAFTSKAIQSIIQIKVLAIAFNNGLAGITTSLFLKSFNSILKTFAGAIELMFTALLARVLFGTQIDIFMVVSMLFVSAALFLYSTQPVVNKPSEVKTPQSSANV